MGNIRESRWILDILQTRVRLGLAKNNQSGVFELF